ncbi:MAG TPA: dienelactone hydrolase family protein [Xanthomonadaceae bacterium]|nr:dienelactone hydrolase family protein [Xanthomonadaceae bacterium]
MRMRWILLPLLFLSLGQVRADMVEREVAYSIGDTRFSSVLVHDASVEAAQPGLVLVPNWMGMTPGNIDKAKAIAARGYVVLVADIYGEDVRPTGPQEASQAARAMLSDRRTLRDRAGMALGELMSLGASGSVAIDLTRIGAIGFCFGGSTVLEMAREGMDLAGVVSFHGGLATDMPAEGGIKASVLVLNGADDAAVTAEHIAAFEVEMRKAGADWQFVNFGGAVHCFAEADAASPPNCIFHERSARRAYALMDAFFTERFAR